MKDKLEPLLELVDVATIFRVKPLTITRWLHDENDFPKPISTPGRRLVWSRDAIEEYLCRNPQIPDAPKPESASKLRQRHNAALLELEQKHGVQIKPRKGKEVNE